LIENLSAHVFISIETYTILGDAEFLAGCLGSLLAQGRCRRSAGLEFALWV
jgi:hypothetical protein